ncbi:MAG: hypothetical protein HFI68_09090 [Lachnospiraceae bacterium]|nr:hypothetical protein [Lachnospiraceae bacterium]
MTEKTKKYSSSLQITLLRGFWFGLLLSFLSAVVSYFLFLVLPGELTGGLYRIFRWPWVVGPGMVLGIALVFFRRTTVEIAGEQVLIHRVGHRECFELDGFLRPSVTRKAHIGSYSKWITVKCYLVFEKQGEIRKIRLYGFREKELETVLAALKREQTELLTEEEKTEVVGRYSEAAAEALIYHTEGENEFHLPAPVLIAKEWACLKKISLVVAGVVIIVGILDVRAALAGGAFSFQLLYLTLLASMLLILLLAVGAGLHIKRKHCAEKVIIGGEYLLVGEQYYPYSQIQKIRLTSPRKQSSSVFPVQHYLYVTGWEGTRKYWLGSDVSFPEYGILCKKLEQALAFWPDKQIYAFQKKSGSVSN